MKKSFSPVKPAVFLSLFPLLFLLIRTTPAYAEPALKLQRNSVTFRADSGDDEEIMIDENDSAEIASAKSENSKIAAAQASTDTVTITPKHVGSTKITVTGKDGSTAVINVKITRAFFKSYLSRQTHLSNCWYGTGKLVITGDPGTTGTVRIGTDTYKYSTGSKYRAVIKLKKVYKLNAKVRVTIKNHGCSYSFKTKLSSDTRFYDVRAKGKTIKVETFNVHKGDIVKVSYKGKTYSRKIRKNKDGKLYTVRLTAKKRVKKNASLTIQIINKKKKTLYQETIKLSKGRYTPEDEAENNHHPEED